MYPTTIPRCHHLKTNGTQCGSPALRNHKFCYFHQRWRQRRLVINTNIQRERSKVTLPVFEDANSIQVGLMEVTRLLLTNQIDHKTAGLLLYALQTASANLKHTSFEPAQPQCVVIDRGCVGNRPIGATAWSIAKDREYDDVQKPEEPEDSLAKILLQRMGLGEELGLGKGDYEDDDVPGSSIEAMADECVLPT